MFEQPSSGTRWEATWNNIHFGGFLHASSDRVFIITKKKNWKKKNGERVKERERERGTRKGRGENPLLRLAKSVVRVLTMSGEDWHHLLDIHCRSAGRGCSSFLLGFNAIAIKVNWSIDQQIRCSFYDLTIEIKQSFSLGLFSFNCIFFKEGFWVILMKIFFDSLLVYDRGVYGKIKPYIKECGFFSPFEMVCRTPVVYTVQW